MFDRQYITARTTDDLSRTPRAKQGFGWGNEVANSNRRGALIAEETIYFSTFRTGYHEIADLILELTKRNISRCSVLSRLFHKYLFSVTIVDAWNSLPAAVLRCNTVENFKRKLDCLFEDRGYE